MNLNSIRSKGTVDLRKAFVDSFDYIVHRTKMDIDQKIKELAEMFAKTSKELADLVKKNEQFIMEEAKRVEEAVRKTSEVLYGSSNKHLKNYPFNTTAVGEIIIQWSIVRFVFRETKIHENFMLAVRFLPIAGI